jgi:hypothetical protein
MDNTTTESEGINTRTFDWHRTSRKVILICKILILIFVLCIIATITLKFSLAPYSYFLVGIEISVAIIMCFMIIRMSTFKPRGKIKPPEHFTPVVKEAELLWFNITYDISRYEEGSSYYFNGVRVYKYSTIILSGISTIILGLDLGAIGLMDYPTFSKNAALIIGAIITVSTSLFTYWNIEKYWLINKTIVNKLRALRDDLEISSASGSLDNTTVKEKIKKYNEVKETFNKYWEGALSERSSQSGGQTSNSDSGASNAQ